jgi:hypothetical protein
MLRDTTRTSYPAAALVALLVLAGCSAPAPTELAPTQAPGAPSNATPAPVASNEPRFDPTAAIGGGINASSSVSTDQLKAVFAGVPQASQLRLSANATPPGATGPDVTSISIRAEDTGGSVLKSLDATAKKSLGDALLNAAAVAWPKARISLLVTDTSGTGGGQVLGTRLPSGTNTVIVS